MYLHIGKGAVLSKKGIIGIIDLDITSQSHLTRKYLSMAEKSGYVINAAEDIPKTFIVCKGKKGMQVYLSQMASSTLLRRAESETI